MKGKKSKHPKIQKSKQTGGRRFGFLDFWTFGLCLTLSACQSQPRVDKAPDKPPSYQQIAEVQNKRIAQLKTVYADGVIEIRWKDEDGNHSHQGDMELWLKLPRHTALRVQKLGEVLLWLGSDDERYWLFDMVNSKEKVLHTNAHNDPDQPGESDAGAMNMKPLALLDLIGLTLLPVIVQNPPAVTFDAKRSAWVVDLDRTSSRGPMRMFFEQSSSFHPVRVESLDGRGDVVSASSLQRYESVTLRGMSPAAFPKIPELIDISGVSGGESGDVKIAINEASGIEDDETLSRVFDLNRLIQGLRPDRIEGVLPPPAATASSNGKNEPSGGNGPTP